MSDYMDGWRYVMGHGVITTLPGCECAECQWAAHQAAAQKQPVGFAPEGAPKPKTLRRRRKRR